MQLVTDKHVFFWHNDCIWSNWYEKKIRIEYKGFLFFSSEALFMFLKAELFKDTSSMLKILKDQSPAKVKNAGRGVKNFNDEIWLGHRVRLMYLANILKFEQNPHIQAELLKTGSRSFVEASPYDKIWGIGMDQNDPDIHDKSKWKGLNLLGQSLDAVKSTIMFNLVFNEVKK
jgi:ribA/ribD-fused uncharacterized protein